MTETRSQIRELFGAYLEHSPFAQLAGLRLDEMDVDRAAVTMPYREELTTFADVLHGGAIATLSDVAAVAAAWSGVSDEGVTTGATVSSAINYLHAARGSDLTATARVTRRSKSFCFCEVTVRDDEDRAIAQAIVTYKLA